MKIQLSSSITGDCQDRGVWSDLSAQYPDSELLKTLYSGNWPKNMTFEVTQHDLVILAKETWWQGDMAKDWNKDEPCAFYRGQITASKFQLRRIVKLMDPASRVELADFLQKRGDPNAY